MIMIYINDYDKELKLVPFTNLTHFTTLSSIRFDDNIVECVHTQKTRDVDQMSIRSCAYTVFLTVQAKCLQYRPNSHRGSRFFVVVYILSTTS